MEMTESPGITFRVVPFEPAHLDGLEFRSQGISMETVFPDLADRTKIAGTQFPAYTAFAGPDVVAVAGVSILWPGVGEAWMVGTPYVDRYPVFFALAVAHNLRRIEDDHNLHRVQCVVHESYRQGHRFVQRLGFRVEGILREYGTNRDNFIRYGRLRAWRGQQ